LLHACWWARCALPTLHVIASEATQSGALQSKYRTASEESVSSLVD